MRRFHARPVLLVAFLMLPGCQTYEPRPLDPAAVVAEVDRARRQAPRSRDDADGDEVAGGPVTFAEVASWMRRSGPEVREAVAAYRTALARAQVQTPFPNPTLGVGPQYGFGDDVTKNRVLPFGSLGLTIPLGGRLCAQDELNEARAEAARIDGVARHRELYLELRREWVRLIAARAIAESHDAILRGAERSLESARRLVDAGHATAVDVALFDLEKSRSEAAVIDAAADVSEAEAAIARTVGVSERHFSDVDAALPRLPAERPDLDELVGELAHEHAGLARRRARYEEAEASLRLEIEKQYPDLEIGPSGGGDVGDDKSVLALTLGIELPLFDRNQPAIAEAKQRREAARVRFEAEASRALAGLERAWRRVEIAGRRHRALRERVLPGVRTSIDLARRTLSAGSGDAFRLIDAERTHRTVLIEVQRAALAELEAWVDLELAVGRPLLRFPSEPTLEAPRDLTRPGDPAAGPSAEESRP